MEVGQGGVLLLSPLVEVSGREELDDLGVNEGVGMEVRLMLDLSQVSVQRQHLVLDLDEL